MIRIIILSISITLLAMSILVMAAPIVESNPLGETVLTPTEPISLEPGIIPEQPMPIDPPLPSNGDRG